MRSDVTAIEIIREFSQLKLSSEIDSLGGVISPMASFDHLATPRTVRGSDVAIGKSGLAV